MIPSIKQRLVNSKPMKFCSVHFTYLLVFLIISLTTGYLLPRAAFSETPAPGFIPEIEAGTGNSSLPGETAASLGTAGVAATAAAVPAVIVAGDTDKKEERKTEQAKKETEAPGKTTDFFSMTYRAEPLSVDAPGPATFELVVENTGDTPLTGIIISGAVPESFSGPAVDAGKPGILDIDETWTYTGSFSVTQQTIDGNDVDVNNAIDGDGDIDSTVTVDFDQTPAKKMTATIDVIQNPQFTVTKEADIKKIDEPGTITYTIRIENTGNLSLNKISISDPLLEDLDGPEDDAETLGVLDVGETWIYTGTYKATQEVIDANGVDANNVIDGDGDIDSTVVVSFAESDVPQTAHAAVKTDVRITGDIFEKRHRYLHGFLSANRTFTTNLYKTDNNVEDCWATVLTPGIWATFPSKMKRSLEIVTQNASPGGLAIEPFNPSHFQRFQAYLLYSPQLEIYHDQNINAYQDPDLGAGIIGDDNVDDAENTLRQFTGQDSVNRLTHRVDAMLHYYSGNKLAIRAIDQYKISYDAFSERAYYTDDKYRSNMFNIAGTLDATEKLRLRLDYSKFCLDYEDDFNRDADRTDDSYAAYLFFRLTAKTSVFVEYDFADIDYDSSSKDSHEHRYFAGIRWEMTGKSSGQIKGGYGKKKPVDSPMIDTDVNISDITSDNWMAAIQIDHNLTEKTNLTINAYRRYDEVLEHRYDYGDLINFYADYTLAHFAGLKFSWNIIPNIHLNLDTSLFYDEFKNSRGIDRKALQTNREDLEFAVSPSVTVELFDHFSVNAAYIYTDHDSNYPGHDYFDHTVFVRASLFL